jgi:hypothetical protein
VRAQADEQEEIMKRTLALAVASLVGAASANAQIVWDENTMGELSGDPASPTPLTFNLGNNIIIGNIGGGGSGIGGPGWDVYSFTIPAGQSMSEVIVNDYAPPGNTTGFNVFDGAGTFLGSTTIDPGDIGLDILAAAVGGPLGAGDYVIELREFGDPQTYELNHILVPAPTTVALLGLGGLVATRRRR